MEYRRLGKSGLQVSALSFGSWVTFGKQVDTDKAIACFEAAREAGVNFFDNAEVYSGGKSEQIMGESLMALKWPRYSYVLSTKLFFGIHDEVNMHGTLNRKYLMQAIEGSLERLQTDFVDLLFCHRPDPNTPVEETVWAMSDIVSSGRALYWGTSEWSAADIRAAWEIAERHHLHKPVVEQPEYNLLHREKVEEEFARLYDECGLGLTTWSPLASGLLTGKYIDGIPSGSRATLAGYGWLRGKLTDEDANRQVKALKTIADDLGCPLSRLALAWCVSNPHVSTVITGASSVEQLKDNMLALEVLPLLTVDVRERIDRALADAAQHAAPVS